MSGQSVKQIVKRCQRGDREAYGLLYEVMYKRLRKVCRHYVAEENAVDDLLHDSFLLIFSKIDSVRDASKAEAWMQKVTQNLALAYVQNHKQQSTISLDDIEPSMIAVAPDAIPITYDEILNLVDALPKSYRRIFRLSVLEGLSHQEIAALLNIEPHTSSSQLYRAKQMLRQSLGIMLLSLLGICLPLGVWYSLNQSTETPSSAGNSKPTASAVPASEQEGGEEPAVSQKETTSFPVGNKLFLSRKQLVPTAQTITPQVITADSAISNPVESSEPDTTKTMEEPQPQIQKEMNIIAETPELPVIKTAPHHDWTVALAYSGINSQHSFNLPYGEKDMNDPVLDTITHHRMPLTIALQVNKMLGNRWSVGSGLQYTQLYSETQIGNTYAWDKQQQRLHYLGIPLRLSWYPVRNSHWSIYGTAQTMLELPLRATQQKTSFVEGRQVKTEELRPSPPLQWSVGLGIGLEYRLTPVIGIYTEPCLEYFFKASDALDTYRTAHPAAFSVPFGIRITFE